MQACLYFSYLVSDRYTTYTSSLSESEISTLRTTNKLLLLIIKYLVYKIKLVL